MNQTRGIVREIDGDDALVEVVDTGCGRCHEDGGCGGKADLTCRAPRRYRVDNRLGAAIGESVNIAINDGVISGLATRVYTIPLSAMLIGAILAGGLSGSSHGEAPAIVGALTGLFAGWLVVTRTRLEATAKPRILSRN